MRIGLKEIDPIVGAAFVARVAEDCYPTEKYLHDNVDWKCAPAEGKRAPTPEEQQAYELHKKREDRYAGWTAATLFLPLITGGVIGYQQGVMPGISAWLVPTLFAAWQMKRTAAKTVLEREISPIELRAAIPLLDLSSAERLYCQAVLNLLEASRHVDESSGREMLRNMNELLARERELSKQTEQVRAAMESNPLQPLEEERARLMERRDAASDPVEQSDLARALELCEARIEHARALQGAPGRLEAQREAIHQALASIPVGIVRQSASSGVGEHPAVVAITDTIAEIAQNAYAEEQAVAEVLALRSD
jgi:hypothetical protein